MKVGSSVKVLSEDSITEQDFFDSILGDLSEKLNRKIIQARGTIIDVTGPLQDYPYVVEFEVMLPIKVAGYFKLHELEEVK